MTVKCAKDHIQQIGRLCDEINVFYAGSPDLEFRIGFLIDAVAFLCDYRRALERAIERAEIEL